MSALEVCLSAQTSAQDSSHHCDGAATTIAPCSRICVSLQLRQRRQRRRRKKPVLKRVASLALVAGVAIAVGRTGSSRNVSRRATSDSDEERVLVPVEVALTSPRRLEPPSIEGWQH